MRAGGLMVRRIIMNRVLQREVKFALITVNTGSRQLSFMLIALTAVCCMLTAALRNAVVIFSADGGSFVLLRQSYRYVSYS